MFLLYWDLSTSKRDCFAKALAMTNKKTRRKPMNRSIIFRIIAGLVLLGALVGLAIFAYNAGVAHGVAVNVQASTGESSAAPYPFYGMPYPMHFFGYPGYGFLSCLIPLFFVFLAFAALRGLFGFRRHGWHAMHYGYGEPGNDVPAMFSEWHRKAHDQPAGPADE
jgi:hypothetical protein